MATVTVTTPLETVSHDFSNRTEAALYREHILSIRPHLWVEHYHEPDADLDAEVMVLCCEDTSDWLIISIEGEN